MAFGYIILSINDSKLGKVYLETSRGFKLYDKKISQIIVWHELSHEF